MASSAEIAVIPFGTHLEDLVVPIHLFDVVHIFRNALKQLPRACDEVFRDVLGHPADANITDGETPAATGFDQIVDFFAWAESIPEVADRAEIHEVGPDAHQVIRN